MKILMVERESFVKDGKSYFSYFVKGNIRGKQVRASIMPPDKGGYTVLDIVFGNENQATLIVTPFEMKDEKGKVVKGNTFGVRSMDELGETYECSIKPARPSDKALLNMLLK